MEKLTLPDAADELRVARFAVYLSLVVGPDDLFPPDQDSAYSKRPPRLPLLSGEVELLAA